MSIDNHKPSYNSQIHKLKIDELEKNKSRKCLNFELKIENWNIIIKKIYNKKLAQTNGSNQWYVGLKLIDFLSDRPLKNPTLYHWKRKYTVWWIFSFI